MTPEPSSTAPAPARAKSTKKKAASKRAAQSPVSAEQAAAAAIAEQAAAAAAADERKLARGAAIAIPVTTVFAAAAVGVVVSAGPAILVLAAGTLLGTIALFWASLRTLTGDAPLATELEHASFSTTTDALVERKRMLLRALKDLESERAVGKIDARDFAALSARFREEIKVLMREMDDSLEPHVARAEALVAKHFVKIGLDGAPFRAPGRVDQAKDAALEADDALPSTPGPRRLACAACAASNEPDARFCKSCGATLTAEIDPAPAEAAPAPQPDAPAAETPTADADPALAAGAERPEDTRTETAT